MFFFICFLGFAGASQESTPIEALNLHSKLLQLPQTTDLDLAVSVGDNKTIAKISSSIIKAETWLKTHVLSRYPSTKITTIVIFSPASCQNTQPSSDLVLSCLKNLYHSLTRWGLEKNIKVSSGFSHQCLRNTESPEMFKPVLVFLKSINSTFTINPPLNFLSSPENHLDLLHSVENFGSLSFNKVNFLSPEPEEATTTMTRRNLRSLINYSRKITISFPTLPSPSPENPPIHSSVGFSPPPQFAPEQSQSQSPISSPSLFPPESPLPSPSLSLPPCLPPPTPSPPPVKKKDVEGLWCVAKPSVAAETLQQSLDFACGQGGANCDEIKPPHGICFYPDTVMAHASYAFNSYWQKTKRNGGTCSFGGTAMLITTDPSYQHCRFVLS
ncbi:unnamed protein product [Microthlaspi erraticum]|uniref:glucan endo-1,3-beta-D-glucosidase n=1 Tax=Microthlaspi erraticum TaxID=1685480 RepID=A0A6D2JBR1_9BRAS|nr:unnamed protein product [Microthlaspi erraticum]